jgi:hypothetical protein
VAALCDGVDGGAGVPPVARVDAQYTYDAYGAVQSYDNLRAHPNLHLGHKGLFVDRLDGPVAATAQGGEPERLAPYAKQLVQMRNRAYLPDWGRFAQRDPNATAMCLISASASHGMGLDAIVEAFSMEGSYSDGSNLYSYLRSNPWQRDDALGTSWDPFTALDDMMADAAAERAAFLSQIGSGMHAVAVVAATIAANLPFPVANLAGNLALAVLNGGDISSVLPNAATGLMPGGRLLQGALQGVGSFAGRMMVTATRMAGQYAARYGRPILAAMGPTVNRLVARGLTCAAQGIEFFMGGKWDTVVYLAYRGGKPVYVGITSGKLNDRLRQHNTRGTKSRGPRGFDDLIPITIPLPRRLAMAIETVIIIENPHFENDMLSIGRGNSIFNAAIATAWHWISANGLQTRY